MLMQRQVQLLPDDVNDEAFAIARARQVNKEGYAKVLEEKGNKKGKQEKKMKNKITVFALSASEELAKDIAKDQELMQVK